MSEEVDEFLAHFGVKGMHWGIRNAESKAREAYNKEQYSQDRVLKKGTSFQTVTAGGGVNLDRRMFTAYTDKDKLAYQSTYAKVLKVQTDKDTFINTVTPNRDLKVASEKVAFDTFKALYEKDKPGMINAMAESYERVARTMMFAGDVKDQAVVDTKVKQYSKKGEKWVNKNGYDLFMIGAGTARTSSSLENEYYTSLTKRGYDAMVDHSDKAAKMADDPIVILKPRNTVSVKSEQVPLTKDDIKIATQAYKQAKKNKNS